MPGKIVSRDEWLTARLDLLAKEKEHTRNADRLASLRANMPMVKIREDYTFTSSSGTHPLAELFENRRQLLVYHFMFDPDWEAGCTNCSYLTDNIPRSLSHLHSQDTTFVLVSRAPIEKIEAFKTRQGWSHIPWYSSAQSTFNYDFHVTQDESIRPILYNYMDKSTLEAKGSSFFTRGEQPGFSVFLKEDNQIYHTYSCYSRGTDHLVMTTGLLDLTPLGRQEDGEKGGKEFKYHDEHTQEETAGRS